MLFDIPRDDLSNESEGNEVKAIFWAPGAFSQEILLSLICVYLVLVCLS